MHQVVAILHRYVAGVRQLNRLVGTIRTELSMPDLVDLATLNEQFTREVRDIELVARETTEALHRYLLAKGLEPRSGDGDRRGGMGDRREG